MKFGQWTRIMLTSSSTSSTSLETKILNFALVWVKNMSALVSFVEPDVLFASSKYNMMNGESCRTARRWYNDNPGTRPHLGPSCLAD